MEGRAVELELIFVHVPKTGGTSLASRLGAHFGPDLLSSSTDRPLDPLGPAHRDRSAFLAQDHITPLIGKRAVTGHIWVRKYRDVPAKIRAAILRDPVDRLVSHYFFWPAFTKGRVLEHSILNRMLAESPSVEEFATWAPIRYAYTESFFHDVDMTTFDYIGDYRDLRQNWEKVVARLGLPNASPVVANQTVEILPDYLDRKQEILTDAKRVGRLRDILKDDQAFYERWATRV